MIRIKYQCPSLDCTLASLKTSVFNTCSASCTSVSCLRLETIWLIGRPMSEGIRLITRLASVVNRFTQRLSSRKMVAILVLSSRFFMSSRAWVNCSSLLCNSVFTVTSSSLSECISSLDVSSSSLVDCSSSLVDCSSSLVDLSSSLDVSSSSTVVCKCSRVYLSSCSSSATRCLCCDGNRPFTLPASTIRGGSISSNTTSNSPRRFSGSRNRLTVRLTNCCPPLHRTCKRG